VLNHWQEPGIAPSKTRTDRLNTELAKFARLADLDTVRWLCQSA